MNQKTLKYPADWIAAKKEGRILCILTAYDATMASLGASSKVDALLVGDSLSMTLQGNSSTLPVTLDEMIYHTRLVRKGAPNSFVIGDLPFGSYQVSKKQGIKNAIRMMKESGASAVKLEGASNKNLQIIEDLVSAGVPVMGHIGLTPQSYMNLGGYKVQGKDELHKNALLRDAKNLENAGCFSMVLEYVTSFAAKQITESIDIPTVGIGSGIHCSGQVQVWNDILGLNPNFRPKHAKRYIELGEEIINTINTFSEEVRNGSFPGEENSF